MIRPDLFFSYWALVWYALYMLNAIQYNPQFWLWIAFITNFYNGYVMLKFQRYYSLLLFMVVVFLFKVLPLWSLQNTNVYKEDIFVGFVLFCIYYAWLIFNNYTLTLLMNKIYSSIKLKTVNETPFMYLENLILKKIRF
jgi:hypothetical protein